MYVKVDTYSLCVMPCYAVNGGSSLKFWKIIFLSIGELSLTPNTEALIGKSYSIRLVKTSQILNHTGYPP